MSLKRYILRAVPAVAGFAAAAGLIESGVAAEISDFVMANKEYLQPAVEGGAAIVTFFGTYYLAEKQCDYFAAETNYIP